MCSSYLRVCEHELLENTVLVFPSIALYAGDTVLL